MFLKFLMIGLGFFADAYDLFVIDIVLAVLDAVQGVRPDGVESVMLTPVLKGLVSSSVSLGAVLGMIFFGLLADKIGRRIGGMITAFLIVVGSIASACCFPSAAMPLVYQLIVCRFVLGFGIGGEYPISATMASEVKLDTAADGRATFLCFQATRQQIVNLVFSLQGAGMLASAVLGLALTVAGVGFDLMWRLLLALGAVPSFAALCLRYKAHEDQFDRTHDGDDRDVRETTRLLDGAPKTSPVASCASAVNPPKHFFTPVKIIFTSNELRWWFMGTASTWFLLDVTFYGTGQFKHVVQEALYPMPSTLTAAAWGHRLHDIDAFSCIVAAMAIPGYLVAVFLIGRLSVADVQLWGFFVLAGFYLLLAAAV
jgi:PHS family inorganic phosphate transporter-like MFS transporter